jgi:hypothetical protein
MAKRKDSRSAADTGAFVKADAAKAEISIMAPDNAAAATTEIKLDDPVTLTDAPTLAPSKADMIGPRRPDGYAAAPEVAPAVETLSKIAAEISAAPKMPIGPNVPMPSSTPKASIAAASAASAPRPLLRMAATVALAAGIGALLGAGGVSAYGRLTAAPVVHTVEANPAKTAKLEGDIAALKASLEASAKNTNGQFGKLAERLDRAEKSQAEPAAKLAKLSDKINDALERFDQRLAAASAPETTGSITPNRSFSVAAAADATDAKPQDKLQDKLQVTPPQAVLTGWVLRDIFDGRALVESRYGMYEVAPGGNLPGIGRVASIKRQDGRWVVTTPKGIIVSER